MIAEIDVEIESEEYYSTPEKSPMVAALQFVVLEKS